MKKALTYNTIAVLLLALTTMARAHCQIPCGIYNDQLRIHLMEEHVTTIEKSMKQIEADESPNQTIRWVMNKEKHADELTKIVTYYFMTQRIKPDMENYEENLKILHEIMIYSMKAKQTTDLANTEKLKELILRFEQLYLGDDADHEHE